MKSGLNQRSAATWALAAVILIAAVFGAFGHAHHSGEHTSQPCAACVASTVLVAGLVLAGFVLIPNQNGPSPAPVRVHSPRKRLDSSSRAQRAPPSA